MIDALSRLSALPAHGDELRTVPASWHKSCGDCTAIRGLKFCTMNCSGIPDNEKVYL